MPLVNSGPLLTLSVHDALARAAGSGATALECSLDLGRSVTMVEVDATGWVWQGQRFPLMAGCKDRTIYHWAGQEFLPASRFSTALVKLVPTEWGPPTFEIDGIKMLPTAKVSPYADAAAKVALIRPRGKVVLDTCGGLGYFAAHCLEGAASRVLSWEKNPDVLWLRSLNPWSPSPADTLTVSQDDIATAIVTLAAGSVDAVLHDPPRFGTAGELYAQTFYDQLHRVLKRRGAMFHYTGSPNRITSGRDVPGEVATRLRRAGFATELRGDGVLATRQ